MSDYWEDNGLVKPQQFVVCAAIIVEHNGKNIMLTGARHWDKVMRNTADALGKIDHKGERQGFIDQFGDFLTREDAMIIAKDAGQPIDIRGCGGSTTELYSEGLY